MLGLTAIRTVVVVAVAAVVAAVITGGTRELFGILPGREPLASSTKGSNSVRPVSGRGVSMN